MSIQPTSSWINWEVQLPNGDITNDNDGTYCIIEGNSDLAVEPPTADHFLIPDTSADDAIQVGEWKVVKMSQVSQVNTTSKKPSTTTAAAEKVKCKICTKSFSSSNYLKDHMRTHTGEKPFQCTECDLAFAQKCNLRMHQRVHSGERPFMCGICGRTFNRSSHLKGHMLQHTGDKPFKCETCGHRFTNAQGKKNHMRLHIGEQPFQCELCGISFNDKSVLKLHVKQHGKESRYSCTICRRKFLLRSSLFEHMTFHSSSKLHTCNQCHKRFKQKQYLQKHKATSCSNKSFIEENPDVDEGPSNDVSKLKYHCLKSSKKAGPLEIDSDEDDIMDFCIETETKKLSLTSAQESRLKYISSDERDYLDESYMKLLKRVGFVQDI